MSWCIHRTVVHATAVDNPRQSEYQDRFKVGHAVSQCLRMQSIIYLVHNLTTQKGLLPCSTAPVVTSGSVSRA